MCERVDGLVAGIRPGWQGRSAGAGGRPEVRRVRAGGAAVTPAALRLGVAAAGMAL